MKKAKNLVRTFKGDSISIFNAVVNDMKKRGIRGADQIPVLVDESLDTKEIENGGTD